MSVPVLTLGEVEFRDFEVPESFRAGGEQMLVVHKLVGGRRVIQAMGRDDAALEWSGLFRGSDAQARARVLDEVRIGGAAQALAFGELAYTVVIRRFVFDQHKPFEIAYEIVCEVVSDDGAPTFDALSGPTVDDMVAADMTAAKVGAAKIGDSKLTGLLSTLDGAISKVSSFATAAQSTIASFVEPIAAVQGRVTALIASAENTMTSVASLGGVLPFNPAAKLVGKLNAQLSAVTQAANLYDLQAVVGRIGINIKSAGSGGALVQQAGGDLYRLAADAYGDPGGWTTIAAANKLTDPVLSGLQTVLVPPANVDTGGVLKT